MSLSSSKRRRWAVMMCDNAAQSLASPVSPPLSFPRRLLYIKLRLSQSVVLFKPPVFLRSKTLRRSPRPQTTRISIDPTASNVQPLIRITIYKTTLIWVKETREPKAENPTIAPERGKVIAAGSRARADCATAGSIAITALCETVLSDRSRARLALCMARITFAVIKAFTMWQVIGRRRIVGAV